MYLELVGACAQLFIVIDNYVQTDLTLTLASMSHWWTLRSVSAMMVSPSNLVGTASDWTSGDPALIFLSEI